MKTTFLKTMLLLMILNLLSCSEKDPVEQLPPITQTGANTFGCLVNGKVFTPKDSYSSTPGSGLFKGLKLQIGENFEQKNGDDSWEILTGNFKTNPTVYLYLYMPKLSSSKKEYNVNTSSGLEDRELNYPHIYCHIDGSNNTYLSFKDSGIINFSRIDIEKKIFSGTFSANLRNKNNPNDVINITQGRFDINLNTINK